jgi:hypothetical protein
MITWQNCQPGVEISTVLAGLKILSCNRAFDFDRGLYYIQGWNLNPVKRAEFNPGVENASFNRPLKTLIPEEIIVCSADPNIAWVTVYESSCMLIYWTEAAQIPESGLKNTCGSGFPTDPVFSANAIIFSMRLNVQPYFLWVVVGCSYSTACQNDICCESQ